MKRTKAIKLNNKGLSLVELIVVIAIMGVLAGVTVISLGVIPRAKINACVQEAASLLEKTRTNGLSFKDAAFVLEVKDDGVYVTNKISQAGSLDSSTTQMIGGKEIEVYYVINEGSETKLTSGKSITISFDRSSGAIKTPVITGETLTDTDTCSKILFKSGSNTRSIALKQLTGKLVLE